MPTLVPRPWQRGWQALEYLPGAGFFIGHPVDDRSAIGFGTCGNFGLAVDDDADRAGRDFTQESTLLGSSFQPTLAHKFTDDISIGIGPRIVHGYCRTEVAVDNNEPGLVERPDGQLRSTLELHLAGIGEAQVCLRKTG